MKNTMKVKRYKFSFDKISRTDRILTRDFKKRYT